MFSYLNRKNLHLIICVLIVIPAGFMYGVMPEVILPEFVEVEIKYVDLKNILRALMLLYLGISAIWIMGILRPHYWNFATILVIVFMGCLVLGRALSWLIDGKPSLFLVLGLFGELILALFGYWQYVLYGPNSKVQRSD